MSTPAQVWSYRNLIVNLAQRDLRARYKKSLLGWLFDRPALVQERSRVLAGHVARSGGGLAYHDYFSFEAALATVGEEQSMAADLGRRGGRYARTEFAWDSVRDRFLSVVGEL